MASLESREWILEKTEQFTKDISEKIANNTTEEVRKQLWSLSDQNREIHEEECFNLDPAANVMNPRAEEILASGLSSRPSLGYPKDKYETGLEAIEEIEVITAELCAEIFKASYAEIRVPPQGQFPIFMRLWQPVSLEMRLLLLPLRLVDM